MMLPSAMRGVESAVQLGDLSWWPSATRRCKRGCEDCAVPRDGRPCMGVSGLA